MDNMASQKVKGIGTSDRDVSAPINRVLSVMANSRLRWVGGLTGLTALTGLALLAQPSSSLWPIYANVLLVHVIVGFVLTLPFLLVGFGHGRGSLKASNKVSRTSGLLLMVTVLLALVSGIVMFFTSGVFLPWMLVLHRLTGILAFLLVVQHCRGRRQKV